MRKRTIQELQREYLVKLYELTDGNSYKEIERSVLNKALDLSDGQETTLMGILKYPNLVAYTFTNAMLTPTGVYLAEEYMAKDYAEKELLVLKTIQQLSKYNPNNQVHFSDLQKAVNMSLHDLNEIITELDNRKGYLGQAFDEHLKLSPAGKEFLQGKSNTNNQAGNTYNTYINAPSNNQIGGKNNTQNAQININPEFDKAIESLVDLVKNSSFSEIDKEDHIADIERIKQLSQKEKSPDVIERAQKKISLLKSALEVGEMVVKATPLLEILSKTFGG